MLNNYHHEDDFNCSQACEQNQTLFVRDAYKGLSACNKNYVTQMLSHASAILVQMLSVFQLGEDTKPFFLYANNLKLEAKDRYLHKILIIGGVDPFVKLVAGEIADCVPPVEACDLVSYLVSQAYSV